MKINIFVAGLLALALPVSGGAQNPSTEGGAFSAEAFRAHVTFLADDLLEGRDTGSRGHEIAARYVATQFLALGLQPGNGDSWFQPIEFVRTQRDPGATLSISGRTFTQGQDIGVRASAAAPVALEAPLVFVGYGLDAPGQGLNDYRGLDVRGKVVVALSGTPADIPSDVAAHLNGSKERMAAARGAIGLIMIPASGDANAWNRLLRRTERPLMTWVEPTGAPFNDGGLQFTATVSRAVADAMFQGARRSLDLVLADAARRGSRPAGFALREQARINRGAGEATRLSSRNVVAILPGSDPALVDQYVLLMAHLDHIGIRDPRPGDAANADRINNGAMDNATGIATLIEVAREMSRAGNRPRRPILFAAVTGEEKGELGSEFLARHPVLRNGRVIGVVNLDMPILTYDFRDVIAFGAEHSTLGPIVERAGARMGVALSPDPLPEEGLFTRSDHYSFVKQGIPSVFLMTGFANGGGARFRAFLDTRYHSPRDDLSQEINWQAGARFAQLNYLIAREIADGNEVPLWYRGSFFGDSFGGSEPRAPRPATR